MRLGASTHRGRLPQPSRRPPQIKDRAPDPGRSSRRSTDGRTHLVEGGVHEVEARAYPAETRLSRVEGYPQDR